MQTALQHTIKVFIRKGEKFFVAECLEVPVVTQGKTIDETVANLKEALVLHLEGEDLEQYGLAPNPILLITMAGKPLCSGRTPQERILFGITVCYLGCPAYDGIIKNRFRDSGSVCPLCN
jgi:predicted RNase H-like HicB family nuclease